MDKGKRAHSVHSSSEDSVPEPKRPKLVKTPKKGQKVQKPVSGFLSVSAVQSSADKASPATFNVDTVVEVYRFGHTKCHYKRHTIVCSSLLDKSLNDFKKSSHQSYGLEEDARRPTLGHLRLRSGFAREQLITISLYLPWKDRSTMAECYWQAQQTITPVSTVK